MRTAKQIVMLLILILVSAPVQAKVWGKNEVPGKWSFETDKPVKLIVIGGSVSQFNRGYGNWIGKTCRNVEVKNVAKARYGSWGIGERFKAQVLKNPNVDLDDGSDYWVILQGGLNNIWEPHKVNSDFMKLFQLIHSKGMKIVGLSLTPWGSDKDKRWRGLTAVKNQDRTQKCVDWMMGRLTPKQAMGKYAGDKKTWGSADLPDIAIAAWGGTSLNFIPPEAEPRPRCPEASVRLPGTVE